MHQHTTLQYGQMKHVDIYFSNWHDVMYVAILGQIGIDRCGKKLSVTVKNGIGVSVQLQSGLQPLPFHSIDAAHHFCSWVFFCSSWTSSSNHYCHPQIPCNSKSVFTLNEATHHNYRWSLCQYDLLRNHICSWRSNKFLPKKSESRSVCSRRYFIFCNVQK